MADAIINGNIENARNLCPAIFAQAPAEHVSAGYTFVPTLEIVRALEAYGWQPEGVAYTRTRRNAPAERALTKAHGVRLGNPNLPTWGKGKAQLVLRTAHDTTSAIQARIGLYTFACANQAVIGDTLGAFRISHLKASLKDILDGIADLVRRVPEVYAALSTWESVRLPSEALAQYRHDAIKLRYPSDDPSAPEVGYNFGRARRTEDEGPTLYSVYQRTQESLLRGGYDVHDPITRSIRRARPIRGVDANIRLNTGLWDLTARYAGELGAGPVLNVAH